MQSEDPGTYSKERIQLAFTGLDPLAVCISKRKVGEHFLRAFDIWNAK